jgi:hypothetical protein
LTGNAHGNLTLQQLIKAPALARQAIQYGSEHRIDPTHIVLNCAHNNKRLFPLCVSAANLIAGESTDQAMVSDFVFRQLQDNLKDDSEHLLRKLIA